MQPPSMGGGAPYLQKFIAGPTKLERNPLNEPRRSIKD